MVCFIFEEDNFEQVVQINLNFKELNFVDHAEFKN